MHIIHGSVSVPLRPSVGRSLSSSSSSSSPSPRPFFEVPDILLLSAPPIRLALPAPRPVFLLSAPPCAGLLNDGLPPQYKSQHQTTRPHNRDYIIREKHTAFDELMAQIDQLGPCRTIEDADAELAEIHEFFEARRRRILDDYLARRRAKEVSHDQR